jgi:prepilin peptidase CpaA
MVCRIRVRSNGPRPCAVIGRMIDTSFLSYAVLALTASILFYAAFADLKNFKIRNELVIVLGLLFFVYAGLAGQWTRIPWNIGLAFLVLAVLLPFYSRGHVGGGDVKLLTVAFLWTGIDCAFAFSLLLLVFAMLHVRAAKFGLANAEGRGGEGRMRIPFAPSIAAALIGVFVLGCLSG